MTVFLFVLAITANGGPTPFVYGPYTSVAACEREMKTQRREIPRHWVTTSQIALACVPTLPSREVMS